MLVETVDIYEIGPKLMTYSSLNLPPMMLAVINVHVDLKENSMQNMPMKSKQTVFLMDEYPIMVIIPAIHITPKQIDTIAPFIIINLSTKSIFLPKHEILGLIDQTDTGDL